MDDKPTKPGSDSLKRDDDLIAAARQQAEAWIPPGSETETTPAAEGRDVPVRFRDLPADSFPGFEIVKEVHRGGQGVVYQAVQRATKRRVAIKVMHEGPFAGPRDKARFEREVQILAALKHPNIVAIHDSGTASGHFFYVMDYISGLPLDQYMASGERSIEETLKLFGKICDAVNAAHLKGVIHRDLKPGNIRIDSKGEPHVLDFGLAKVAMGDMTNDSRPAVMSMTGQFIGSLPWASPEQAEAVPDKIDIRTDVYSLGVILYQMLTGKFPYEVVGNMRDVLDRILKAEPTKPSTIRRQINDEVETIVLKCLQKERERRYQSAGELARDVGHYLLGEPIEAKRDSTLYVVRKMILRSRATVAGLCLFIVCAAISGFYYWEASLAERRAQRAAQYRFGSTAQHLLGVADRLILQHEIVAARALLRYSVEIRGRQGDQDPDSEANQLEELAQRFVQVGDDAEAESLARQELAIRRALASDDDGSLAHLLQRLGELLIRRGEITEGAEFLKEALAIWRKQYGDESPSMAMFLRRIGSLLLKGGFPSEAEPLLRESLDIETQRFSDGSRRRWLRFNAMSLLGSALADQGEFAAAEPLLVEAWGQLNDDPRVPPSSLIGFDPKLEVLQRIVRLYDAWHAAEPDRSYDDKAAEWRAKLVEWQATTQPVSSSSSQPFPDSTSP